MTDHDPDHYKVGGIETIEYMRAKSTPEEFAAYCKLSVEKYRSRAGKKDGATELQDARKALKFCEWWVEALEGEPVEDRGKAPPGWNVELSTRTGANPWNVRNPAGEVAFIRKSEYAAMRAAWWGYNNEQGNTK